MKWKGAAFLTRWAKYDDAVQLRLRSLVRRSLPPTHGSGVGDRRPRSFLRIVSLPCRISLATGNGAHSAQWPLPGPCLSIGLRMKTREPVELERASVWSFLAR